MPKLVMSRSRWLWVGRIFIAAYLGAAAYAIWDGETSFHALLPFLLFLGPTINLVNLGHYSGAFVLLDDVLALPGNGIRTQYIPLAVAEAKPGWFGWTFRWKEGRRNQSVHAYLPRVLRGPLGEAMATAKAGAPETQAQTAKEAAAHLRVTVLPKFPLLLLLWLAALVVAIVSGLWLKNPIPMGIAAVMALFLPMESYPIILSWAGETLWILKEQEEPYAIPLEKVTEMRTSQSKGTRIFTTDPAYPEIQVAGWQDDFVKAFERRLAGTPEPAPAPPAATALRCSLCGSPAPGLTAAAGTGVYICETCANRTRLEATEGGHGLSPKDPKPM